VPAASRRAGFARQGAKEKQLLKEGNAFNVSSFVLRAMMSGQYWPEGDEVYHAELAVPVLLVHGMHDKFVPVEEDQRMAEVGDRAGLGVGEGWALPASTRQCGLGACPGADACRCHRLPADPADRLPEGDRRGQPHGDDGVSRDGEHAAPRVRPVGARDASWGRASGEEIRQRDAVTGLLRWERCFGAEKGLRERRGAAEAALAGSSARFLSRPHRRPAAEHGGSPRQGCAGPAAGTRQTWSLSPQGWHGSRWSVFILFLSSIIFLMQRHAGDGEETAAGRLVPPAAKWEEFGGVPPGRARRLQHLPGQGPRS